MAGVVLAGGRSSRMGRPKAALDWHGSTLLRRVTGLLQRGVDGPVLVVRAPGQSLPGLPPGIEVVDDPAEGLGPLQGLAVGLSALQGRAASAFVCATDLPLLHPAFVRRVTRDAGAAEVVLPIVGGHRQPLAACYATSLAGAAARLVSEDRLKVGLLFDEVTVLRLDESQLRADPVLCVGDPQLSSVAGVNTIEEYEAARALPEPEVTVELSGVLAARGSDRGPRTLRASTLGGAAAAVDVLLDRHVLAAVNGDQASRDGEFPLVRGDLVTFMSAGAGG